MMATQLASRYEHDAEFLAEILDCYQPHCRYLRWAAVDLAGDTIRGSAALAIPQSCYINDTGHLNSVEVNICYNQMLYQAIATAVRHRLGAVFSTWSMADFRRRKLSDVLIARFTSSFHRPIDPRSFHGEISLDTVIQRRLRPDSDPLISMETSFRYWDDNGGSCTGNARVAIVGR